MKLIVTASDTPETERLLDNFAASTGYRDEITDAEGNRVPNPLTRTEHNAAAVLEHIKERASHEAVNKAIRAMNKRHHKAMETEREQEREKAQRDSEADFEGSGMTIEPEPEPEPNPAPL